MKIILLEGEDVYLKLKRLEEIRKEFSDLKEGVNYFKYQKIEIEDLIYQIEMPSFLAGNKLIIVEDETYFKQAEKNFKNFIKFLETDIWDINVSLVLIYNQKLRDTNKLKKILLQKGRVINISKPTDQSIRREIIEFLEKENGYMEYKTMVYFIEAVGSDLYKIINELDKVLSYVKSKETEIGTNIKNVKHNIRKEDVDKIVNKTVSSKMFEVTKVLEIGQNKKAINIINENFDNKRQILGLISYLYSYYFDIYLTKEAEKRNISPKSILNLPPNRAFLQNIYRKVAGKMSMDKIKYILKELARIDRLTKTENIDTFILLKALIMYI